MGPPVDSVNRCRTFKWLNMAKHGRYNDSYWELFHGLSTNLTISGEPHLVVKNGMNGSWSSIARNGNPKTSLFYRRPCEHELSFASPNSWASLIPRSKLCLECPILSPSTTVTSRFFAMKSSRVIQLHEEHGKPIPSNSIVPKNQHHFRYFSG